MHFYKYIIQINIIQNRITLLLVYRIFQKTQKICLYMNNNLIFLYYTIAKKNSDINYLLIEFLPQNQLLNILIK